MMEMTRREELKRKHDELAGQYTSLNHLIRARKAEVRAQGGMVKTDLKLLQLKAKSAALSCEIQQVNNAIAAEPNPVSTSQMPRAERNRPDGPVVDVSKEIFGMNAVQKRLMMLLAREVGFNRYDELRRIAAADYRHKETEYYTGSKKWNPDATPVNATQPAEEEKPEALQRRLAWEKPELTETEEFDRMMRGNSNRYGGENL